MERSEAAEHLQYIDDIIMWGNTIEDFFEKGKENSSNPSEIWFCHKKK